MKDMCIIGLILLLILQSLYYRKKERKLVHNIKDMIDDAMTGKLKEKRLDETRASEIESEMWRFLSDCQVSSVNLAEQKKQIQTLISDIAHQTMTPISNLKIYTELLEERRTEDPEEEKEVLTIGSQVAELEFLVDSLVKLSRLETGIISVNVKEDKIQKVLSSVEQRYRAKAEKKNIEFTVESSKELAKFDAKWTTEAVANVVDNAMKYTPEGGKVQITVEPYSLFLRINIEDTGMGISEADQSKIFTRFYRSPEVSEEEGVGIGLYLTREILKVQDAYIKVISTVGKGSVFSIFLLRS